MVARVGRGWREGGVFNLGMKEWVKVGDERVRRVRLGLKCVGASVGLIEVEVDENPHPLRTEGAAPRSSLRRTEKARLFEIGRFERRYGVI
jgi:hypothetical protein